MCLYCISYVHTDLSNQLDGGAWTEILSSTWFGTSDPYTGRILDGRWESSPVPTINGAFLAVHDIDKSSTYFPDEQVEWYVSVDVDAIVKLPFNFILQCSILSWWDSNKIFILYTQDPRRNIRLFAF
jgi:hypothetical protein